MIDRGLFITGSGSLDPMFPMERVRSDTEDVEEIACDPGTRPGSRDTSPGTAAGRLRALGLSEDSSSSQQSQSPCSPPRSLGLSCPSPAGTPHTLSVSPPSPGGLSRTYRTVGLSSRTHHHKPAVSCPSPDVPSRIHHTVDLSSPSPSRTHHHNIPGFLASSPEGPSRIYHRLSMSSPSPETRTHYTIGASCNPEEPSRLPRPLSNPEGSTSSYHCLSPDRSFRTRHPLGVSCPSPEQAATSNEPPQVSNSRLLKFGMDRILSEDISPQTRRHPHADLLSPPCSQCVSSLLRCCRLGTPYPGSYYPAQIHAPRPIRPYNNLLVTESAHISPAERSTSSTSSGNKRKRSWSRAVFSNLQRKGLEKRFQLQKYITKPDRRQLAATLGLTDAQVKVWFQNRRMKWRHSKEAKHEGNVSIMGMERKEEQGKPDSTQEPEIDV